MSHKLKLGTFQKYEESTAQPNTTTWAEYDIVFKDGSDVVNPTITLAADLSTVQAYNYGYMLGRYYWVVEKRAYRTGVCQLRLETDVLATYKTEIGSSSLYVLRSSAASDGYIQDRFYPCTTKVTKYLDVPGTEQIYSFSSGVYVVQVAGQNTGSTTLYEMSPSAFSSFIDALLGVYNGLTWNNVEESIQNTLFQPMQYIYSVRWYPKSFGGTPVNNISIGFWSCSVTANVINNPFAVAKSFTISLHDHPQISRGKFLNSLPYRYMELFLPPFGIINLDTSKLVDSSSLYVAVYVDALTGSASAYGRDENGQKLFTVSGQWGVNLPITQGGEQGGNIIGGAISTIGTAVAAAASGGLALGIGAGVAAIGDTINTFSESTSNTGSQGTLLAFREYASLATYCYHIADEDNTHNGRPYCKVTTPSNLGGFMIVQRGDVDIPGTLPEEQKIKLFLEKGFYYE